MKLIEFILFVVVLFVAATIESVVSNMLGLNPTIGFILTAFFVGFAFLIFIAIKTEMQSRHHQE